MVRREERSPLYDGVVFGSGGRAGGKFLFTNDDETPSSVVATGTAQSASGGEITLSSSASSVDDFYNGYALEITAGTGSGQDHQRVIDYNGTTKVATVSGEWITTPDSTSQYRIVNRGY